MTVIELQGAELDYWVAQAEGELDALLLKLPYMGSTGEVIRPRRVIRVVGNYATDALPYSSDWAHGGPLVEREWLRIRIQLEHWHSPGWPRSILCGRLDEFMRAYVAGKFGETVPPGFKVIDCKFVNTADYTIPAT